MSILVWQVNSIGITMYLGVLVYEKKKKKERQKTCWTARQFNNSVRVIDDSKVWLRENVYIFWPNSAQHGAQENCLWLSNRSLCCVCTYCKIASSNNSCLEAHASFFRLLMKVIFDPYVLWLFDKNFISYIRTCNYMVDKISSLSIHFKRYQRNTLGALHVL